MQIPTLSIETKHRASREIPQPRRIHSPLSAIIFRGS